MPSKQNKPNQKVVVKKVVKRRRRKPKQAPKVNLENEVVVKNKVIRDNKVVKGNEIKVEPKAEPKVEPIVEPKARPKRKKVDKLQRLNEMRKEIVEAFDTKNNEIAEIKDKINKMSSEFRNLNRKMNRYFREMDKYNSDNPDKTKKNRKRRSKLTGIAGPTLISDKLCEFMELEHGSKVSRTNVNKKLNQYIKERDLQNLENNSVINVDDTLKHLLNVSDEDQVTYFNMQGYMKHNYLSS